MIDALNQFFSPMLETRLFGRTFDFLMAINPVALVPQVWVAITAPSVEGISLATMGLFFAIQLGVAFQGIRTKTTSMFLGMVLSAALSLTIIVVVLVRG